METGRCEDPKRHCVAKLLECACLLALFIPLVPRPNRQTGAKKLAFPTNQQYNFIITSTKQSGAPFKVYPALPREQRVQQAQRDETGTDLGWHYDPADLLIFNYTVSNASLT